MRRKTSHFENEEPLFEKILRYLRFKKVIKYIPRNSKVLDLGCGYQGKLLQLISSKISKGYGIDISVCKDPIKENIKLIEHNLKDPLPFKNNEFDVVTSLANLEHLYNPEFVLREAHRVLKPGGLLLVTVPSTYSKPILEFLSFRLGLISEQEIKDHKQYLNKKILTTYCKKIGFKSYVHRYFQFFMNNLLIGRK